MAETNFGTHDIEIVNPVDWRRKGRFRRFPGKSRATAERDICDLIVHDLRKGLSIRILAPKAVGMDGGVGG